MGYFSCNAESAIATCDPYNWDSYRKRRKNKNQTKPNKPIKIREFSYTELVKATSTFSAETFLGKGSHGTVYKAFLDQGKLLAAVKKTTHQTNSCNSYNSSCSTVPPEDNEIEILSRVQHPRLVNLLGFCVDPTGRKLLVVEYMPNGSLYDLLHSSSRPPGWTRRVQFALQIAKAVQALHASTPPVIHRDIKSSNVLIDEYWKARLGDFGLALRGHVEDVHVKCTPPAGTLGYLDPAYLAPGDLSAKSDVFSFGILLLEIISGRNAIDVNYSPPSVVDWAVPLIKKGNLGAICDNRVASMPDPVAIRNLSVLAARCVRSTAEKRPGMAEVVEGLKIVSRRIHAPPIWNHLRRRVRRVEEVDRVVDRSEEIVSTVNVLKTVRVGGRRNRKVSSVSRVEYGSETIGWGGDRVMRSKSIGSFGEIKTGSDYFRRKPVGVAVKMPVVKLSKSRSMGVLQSHGLVPYKKRGFVFEFGTESSDHSRENDAAPPVPHLFDEKLERKILEKPLVSKN
ncbi:serine/threonine-protein kinase protein [Salix suchowensis]|nr:serine/threonine-protein kinase protein [Salix suchowensis]